MVTREEHNPHQCAAEGCSAPAVKVYCSNRCANRGNGKKRDRAYFIAIGKKGAQARWAKGHPALTAADRALMEAGEYEAAARQIRDRSYASGWMAHHKGSRRMPTRKGTEAA